MTLPPASATAALDGNGYKLPRADYGEPEFADFDEAQEAQSTASVPFMITAEMKAKLAGLGYSPNAIFNMLPADAHKIITGQIKAVEPAIGTATIINHPNPAMPGWRDGEKAGDVPIAVADEGNKTNGASLKGNLNSAIAFLHGLPTHLWCITAIFPDGDTRTVTFGPGQEDSLVSWLRKFNGNRNIYYSINQPRGPRQKKLKKDDIGRVIFLHCDIDRRPDETRDQCHERALKALEDYELQPSFIIDSGNGVQAIWIIEPTDLPKSDDPSWAELVDKIEGRNRALADTLGGDSGTDISRLFRLPGTINLPNAVKTAKGWDACATRLIEATGAVYRLEDFPYVPPKAGVAPNGPLPKIEIDGDLPQVDVEDLNVSDRIKDIIRTGQSPDYPSRSEAMFAAVLAMLGGAHEPSEILAVLLNRELGISAHIFDQKRPRLYAERQIARGKQRIERPDIEFLSEGYGEEEKGKEAPREEAKPEPPKTEQPKKIRFRLKSFRELLTQPSREALIKGLIPKQGIVIVWGPPKCGKSFWVFTLMMHVAMGWEYQELRVKAADVVYLALEGQHGFSDRAKAFYNDRFAKGEIPENEEFPRFHLVDTSIELVKDYKQLIADIAAQSCTPGVVVIDTLNRSITGSESSDADMTAYINAAKIIHERFKCAVIIIHHCGHDATRMRGHTALHGAEDVMISVKRDTQNNIIATVDDARDMANGKVIASTLEIVKIGVDEDGDDVTSCIVNPADPEIAERAEGASAERPTRTSKALRNFHASFDDAVLAHGFLHRVRGEGPTVRAVETHHVRDEFSRKHTPDPGSDAKDPKSVIRSAFKYVWDKLPSEYGTENYHGKSLIWHTKRKP